MRRIILGLAVIMAGQSAVASSIEPITQMKGVGADSIVTKSCSDCPPLVVPVVKRLYVVPELPRGTQRVELRDINGEKKIARTEAWMGGSPVVMISKPTPETLAAAGLAGDEIDPSSTMAISPAHAATAATPKTFDLSGLELRP